MTSLPDKNYITDAYAASIKIGPDNFVFFGADRFSNSGDSNVGFWFFQQEVAPLDNGTFSGRHTIGDVLIVVNYENPLTFSSYEWTANGLTQKVANSYISQCTASSTANYCSNTNNGPVTSPWSYTPKSGPSGTFPANSFMEGVFNSTVFLGPGENRHCFSTFLAVSRASTSDASVLKDFIFGAFQRCSLTAQVSCLGTGFNSDHTQVIYNIAVNVTNNGDSSLTGIQVLYDGANVATITSLAPGMLTTCVL